MENTPCLTADPVACRHCDLSAICRLTGLIVDEDGNTRRMPGGLRSIRPGAALYSAGAPATNLFAIRSGMIKRVELSADGEERVVSFHIPGDVLGLEAFSTGVHNCDAIALGRVQYCELPPLRLTDESQRSAAIARTLVQVLGTAANVQSTFTRGSARRRVTAFLLDLSQRARARGFNGEELHLPMSRLEIANLLDTRIETVSRMLQQMHRERAVHVSGSRVRLLNLEPQAELASSA